MSIQIPAHAQKVLDLLEAAGHEAYVVGGCVRDSLMGQQPLDWDVCTKATPQQSLRVFAKLHCIKTGLQHGTITVMVEQQPVEVTSYRLDGNYSDNRHPDQVTFVSDLKEDLARRDFTINAMAYSPSRGLVDCFKGQQDLKAGLIRCVGKPTERFHEDGLRIMRALRFASRLCFDIDSATTEAIRSCCHLLKQVSVERIYKELKGILKGKGARSMMVDYPELFESIMPELGPMIAFEPVHKNHPYGVWEHTAHVVQACPEEENLRLAALFHDAAKPHVYRGEIQGDRYLGHADDSALLAEKTLKRLKSDNSCISLVKELVAKHDILLPTRRAGMRKLMGSMGVERLQQLFLLRRADLMSHESREMIDGLKILQEAEKLVEELLALPACYTVKDLAINGKDLIAQGMKPGPEMREILEQLLAQVQEDELVNERGVLMKALAARGNRAK